MSVLQQSCVYYNRMILYVQQYLLITLKFHENWWSFAVPTEVNSEISLMKLKFTKMHGLGNDFVVIDAVNQSMSLTSAQLRLLADRHFGIGCDQILLVEKAEGDADFRYRIYNADGGEVEQCGNGARCFVRYVHDRGMTQKK